MKRNYTATNEIIKHKLEHYDKCSMGECAVAMESITELMGLLFDVTARTNPTVEECKRVSAVVGALDMCIEELRNMLEYMCEHGEYQKWPDESSNENQGYIEREETIEGGRRVTWMVAKNAKEALFDGSVILKNDPGYAVHEANTQDHKELLGAIRRDIAAEHLAQ